MYPSGYDVSAMPAHLICTLEWSYLLCNKAELTGLDWSGLDWSGLVSLRWNLIFFYLLLSYYCGPFRRGIAVQAGNREKSL